MTYVIDIRTAFRNGDNVSKPDMKKLYEAAKEAYYNGEPILEDFEFDSLESALGLENKSYVGTKHNESYTVKHPFIMGSLSKVQIHQKNSTIDWDKYFTEVNKYICRNINNVPCIVTPKFDGCSFEANCKGSSLINISSRGDGNYGKDYTKHLERFVIPNIVCLDINKEFVIRGEVLINKKVFAKKYSDFVNPRSFVSGILNHDYSEDAEFQDMLNDLSIVIYDIRIKDELNYTWKDTDWTHFNYPDAPKYHLNSVISTPKSLADIYNTFAKYRETCEFALDGIVIKPIDIYREENLTDHRPKDCVAIKFMPMLEETEVIDIEWNLGKSGEYTPIIITNPVIMDGKSVTRAKANNLGYLIENRLSIGSKIVFSLAGDIIPFIYKITNTDNYSEDKLNLPTGNVQVDGIHLMAVLNEKDANMYSFINSANTLNIDKIGPATVKSIYNYLENKNKNDETSDFFEEDTTEVELPFNILLCSDDDIYNGAGGGKTGDNCKKSFNKYIKNISLTDIIKSCNFKGCGEKIAEQCANYLLGLDYSFSHLNEKGYEWVMNDDSNENKMINKILVSLNKSLVSFKEKAIKELDTDKIPVILTGEPNNWKSKADFIAHNQEYRVTTSWKEVKIVFTNSLDSNTGKMRNARERGIEIREY